MHGAVPACYRCLHCHSLLGNARNRMTRPPTDPSQTVEARSTAWSEALAAQLAPGETLAAWLETDLSDTRRFAPGFVALTDQRLLAAHDGNWQAWPLTPDLTLRHQDHGGVGV